MEGKKVAIINFGARLKECLLANETLIKKGINISLVDARFAKPLDENLIWQIATDHEAIITIEEGSIGGFGSHVGQFLAEKNLLDNNLKFRSMILPDKFIDHNKPELMYKEGLFGGGIISDKRYVVILLGPDISSSSSSDVVAIWADHSGLAGFAREYFEYLLKDSVEVK